MLGMAEDAFDAMVGKKVRVNVGGWGFGKSYCVEGVLKYYGQSLHGGYGNVCIYECKDSLERIFQLSKIGEQNSDKRPLIIRGDCIYTICLE